VAASTKEHPPARSPRASSSDDALHRPTKPLALSNDAPTDGAVLRSAQRSPVPTVITGDRSSGPGSSTAETVRSLPTSGARSRNPTLTLRRAEPTSPFRLAFAKRCQISRPFQPLPRHEPELATESRRTRATTGPLPCLAPHVRRESKGRAGQGRAGQGRTTPGHTEVLRLGVSANCFDGPSCGVRLATRRSDCLIRHTGVGGLRAMATPCSLLTDPLSAR